MWKFETYKASWLESFNFLAYDSITLLLLVSLKTLARVYLSLLRAWFLPLTFLVGLVLTIPRLLGAFYITLVTRAARPSLDYKNTSYWQKTIVADWLIFFGVLAIVYLPSLWPQKDVPLFAIRAAFYSYDVLLRVFFLADHLWVPGTQTLGVLTIFLSPFLILWTLFLFDARLSLWSTFKALGRATSMLAYNYPFFFVVYAVIRVTIAVGYVVFSPFISSLPQLPIFGWTVLLAVLIPYWVCFITNFYVKRLHEQFSLYYSS